MRIAVAINVHSESSAQIKACFGRIAANLPAAVVGIFCNGDVSAEIKRIAREHQFLVFPGANLASNITWHLWWLRMLLFFREIQADVFFKFDPDTMVDARPECIPRSDYFGFVSRSRRYRIPYIQGGVTGLSWRCVCSVLDSGLLSPNGEAPALSEHTWDSFADDQHLAVVLARLHIFPVMWPECKSIWKVSVDNDPVQYAIVHPRYYVS